MLSTFQEATTANEQDMLSNPRVVDARVVDEPAPTESIELAKHESEEALKAAVKLRHSA
jgi:hypothetical protein